ncbi:MAG: hypothetical protein ACPLRN_01750 [Microgenomates group bacterium]
MEQSESPCQLGQRKETKQLIPEITAEDLCQFLTGFSLTPENYSKIIQRLRTDRDIVRKKYGLPPLEMLKDNPREFERSLQEIATGIGVTILPRIACGSFFEEILSAKAVFLSSSDTGSENDKIGVDIKDETLAELIKSLLALEHELIHAQQHIRYPQMPLEVTEYEAYVASVNLKALEEDPTLIRDAFFDFFVGGSTRTGYRLLNEDRKRRGLPAVIPDCIKK